MTRFYSGGCKNVMTNKISPPTDMWLPGPQFYHVFCYPTSAQPWWVGHLHRSPVYFLKNFFKDVHSAEMC